MMTIELERSGIKHSIEEELKKQEAELVKPNIVVVGGTGAGKSALINRFFGKYVAEVGNGKPVTKGMNKVELEGFSVVIYDTEGYEISSGTLNRTNFDENIKPEIEKMNAGELKDQVHLVWYCVSVATHRVTDYDLENITYFCKRRMRTAVVFTQCDKDEELANGSGKDASTFKKVIANEIKDVAFFETCATNPDLLLDLDKLRQWSQEALPTEQLKQAFISAQILSIPAKKEAAYKIVMFATTTIAATAGFNPVPLSDSIFIVPQQMVMCVKIGYIFGFGGLGEAAGSLLKSQLVSMAGKQVAASLTKFIPVIGQIINAAVAAALTFGLGMALIEIYAKCYKDVLETGKTPEWTAIFSSDVFMNMVKTYMDQYKK
jgi:uncharacterized protein (DUF697 family)/GTP-binding protein EngB required for normal cell division